MIPLVKEMFLRVVGGEQAAGVQKNHSKGEENSPNTLQFEKMLYCCNKIATVCYWLGISLEKLYIMPEILRIFGLRFYLFGSSDKCVGFVM